MLGGMGGSSMYGSLGGNSTTGLSGIGGGSTIELQQLLTQVTTLQTQIETLAQEVAALQTTSSNPQQLDNPLNDTIWRINNDGSIEGGITSNNQTSTFFFQKDPLTELGYLANSDGIIVGDGDSYVGADPSGSAVLGNITQDTKFQLLSTDKTARLTLGMYGPMFQLRDNSGNLEALALPKFQLKDGSDFGIDTSQGTNQMTLTLGSNAALILKPDLPLLQGVALRNIVQGLHLDAGDTSLVLPGAANTSKGLKLEYTSSASLSFKDRSLHFDGTANENSVVSDRGLLFQVADQFANTKQYTIDYSKVLVPDQSVLEFANEGLYNAATFNAQHLFRIQNLPYLAIQPGVLQAYNQTIAQGFSNNVMAQIQGDELVTWGLLQQLIDTLIPIGSLQISSNSAPPNSFQGYITWTLYATLDNKYMKFTTNGALVGTAQAESVLSHSHTSGTLQTVATSTASGTTVASSTGTGNTGTGVLAQHSTNTGTTVADVTGTGVTGNNIPHPLIITESAAAGGNNANSAAVGNTTALGAPGTPALTIGAHTHNVPALTIPSLTVNSLVVPQQTIPSLSVPSLTVPSLTVNPLNIAATNTQGSTAATGGVHNEVAAVFMLVYRRTA